MQTQTQETYTRSEIQNVARVAFMELARGDSTLIWGLVDYLKIDLGLDLPTILRLGEAFTGIPKIILANTFLEIKRERLRRVIH